MWRIESGGIPRVPLLWLTLKVNLLYRACSAASRYRVDSILQPLNVCQDFEDTSEPRILELEQIEEGSSTTDSLRL